MYFDNSNTFWGKIRNNFTYKRWEKKETERNQIRSQPEIKIRSVENISKTVERNMEKNVSL